MPLVAAAVGAFFGGLAAFVVSQVNESVKRRRERWFKHRNALVQLEYLLNEITDVLSANRHVATVAIGSIPKNDIGLRIVWSEPRALPYDSSLLTTFLRIELIKELF